MTQLTQEEVIKQLNELLQEDISDTFQEQLTKAGEHGAPSFLVRNRSGREVEVTVDWNKEADELYYSILH